MTNRAVPPAIMFTDEENSQLLQASSLVQSAQSYIANGFPGSAATGLREAAAVLEGVYEARQKRLFPELSEEAS